MDYSTVVKEPIQVIGVNVVSINAEIPTIADIEETWKKFIADDIFNKIPQKANTNVIVLRYDYEGEKDKTFHCIIGCEVLSTASVPPGMAAKEIHASTYAEFPVKGSYPESLITTWEAIAQGPLKRSFAADFELYKTDNGIPKHDETSIFISLE